LVCIDIVLQPKQSNPISENYETIQPRKGTI